MKEENHISRCLSDIEAMLNWGNSENWSSYDYERLVTLIQDKTGERLSSTTLKRLWGALSYQSQPTTQTLNVLARYLGHGSWTEYVASDVHAEAVATDKKRKAAFFTQERARKLILGGVAIGTIAFLGISIGFGVGGDAPGLTADELGQVSFYSEPVTAGVPNTVIFHYDIGTLEAQQVKIQQNWDARRQFAVDKHKNLASSIYFFPGHWQAKLIVDDQIVSEHHLLIPSEGWLATIDTEPRPRYITSEMHGSGVFGTDDDFDLGLVSKNDQPEWMTFHFIKDFGALSGNDFRLDATLQNTYRAGNSSCLDTRVMVLCTEGFFVIPLSVIGCVGDLRISASEQQIYGSEADLTALGCQFDAPVHLEMTVRDKHLSIILDDKDAFELTYQESVGDIRGLRFKFRGSGILDDVSLQDKSGEIVYQETFDVANAKLD